MNKETQTNRAACVATDRSTEKGNATGARCQWLTVNELQEKLQISRSTVNRWMKLGVIRGYRFEGSRTLYFLDSEVDNFLSKNAITPSGRLDKVGLTLAAT